MHAELQRLLNQNVDAKHVCIITDNNRFIVGGWSRRMGERFSHAEVNAIRELSGQRGRYWRGRHRRNIGGGLTLMVVRYKNGQLRESKPCSSCCASIRESGLIKYVCFSTSDGTMKKLRTCDLSSTYVSTGDAYLRGLGLAQLSSTMSRIRIR